MVHCGVTVVLRGVRVTSSFPVFGAKQLIAQYAGIAQSQRQALAPGGVARCRGVPNKSHASLVGMLDPGFRSIKCRERPCRLRAVVKLRIHPRSLEALEVSRKVCRALIARLGAGVKAKVSAGAPSSLREQ